MLRSFWLSLRSPSPFQPLIFSLIAQSRHWLHFLTCQRCELSFCPSLLLLLLPSLIESLAQLWHSHQEPHQCPSLVEPSFEPQYHLRSGHFLDHLWLFTTMTQSLVALFTVQNLILLVLPFWFLRNVLWHSRNLHLFMHLRRQFYLD